MKPFSLKVNLRVRPERRHVGPSGDCQTELVSCLPFFKGKQGTLTHRVRAGTIYWRDGEYSHTAVKFWCGNNGFIEPKKGTVMAQPAEDAVLCGVCEGRMRQNG